MDILAMMWVWNDDEGHSSDHVLMLLARKRPHESKLFQPPDQLATRDWNEPRQLAQAPWKSRWIDRRSVELAIPTSSEQLSILRGPR